MNKFKIEFKWTIYLNFVGIMWFQLEKFLGYHDEKIIDHALFTNFIYIFIFGVYVLFLIDKKKNFFNGNMSWQQGWVSGVVLSLFNAILTPFAIYFSLKYINADFFENMINHSVSMGRKPDDIKAFFNLKTYILFGTFGAISFGIIFAAISASLIKSKK